MDRNTALVKLQAKSMGLGVILTLVFSSLGMFYLGIWQGLIALFFEAMLAVLVFFSAGLLAFLFVPFHIICVIITVVSINNHNQRLIRSLH
ncbi:MAG: hypothetical protein LBS31_10765 [Candidatus Adiutrix sp.]|jgi:hypothetical protein|nr:hypothetical protein [Candidatus Adiutrix sp.]